MRAEGVANNKLQKLQGFLISCKIWETRKIFPICTWHHAVTATYLMRRQSERYIINYEIACFHEKFQCKQSLEYRNLSN